MFNEHEKAIIIRGKELGKRPEEVQLAIARYRAGITTNEPEPEPEKPGFFQGVRQDFNARVDQAATAQRQAIEGDRSDASAAGRTLGAGGRFIGDIGARALSAVTPDPLGDLAIKGVQKVAGSKAGQAIGSAYQSAKTAHPELVEGVEDVFSVGSALLAPGLANAGTKATISAASQSAKVLGNITSKGTKGIREAASLAVDPANLMQRVARVSKGKQAAFEERAGESIGQYLVSRGIFGDVDEITTQVYSRFDKSKGEVDKALASLPGKYKNTAVGSALKELAAREQRVSSPGAVSKDIERVRELLKKHNGAGLNMEEVNEVKRLYERNVRLDYIKENVPDKVQKANNIDAAIREWQQNQASQLGFKNIQELNRETYLAKQLVDDLGAEYAGSAGNNAITLTDWVLIAGTSADPATAIGSYIAKKAISSKGVMSGIAKLFTRRDPMGQPKAKMTAPTIDNYLNFLKKTTQPTIDIDTPIKNYVNESQPGLSVKSVAPDPLKVAQSLSAGQYKALREYLATRTTPNAPLSIEKFNALQEALEGTKVDVDKFNLDSLDEYLANVVEAYDDSL